MADNPVGHESAIAAAGNAEPFRVNVRIFSEHFVGKFHDIIVINGAVFAVYIAKFVAAAVAAPGIAVEHEVTCVGPHLHFMVIDIAKYRTWAAMDMKYRRILFPRLIARRLHSPAVYLEAV